MSRKNKRKTRNNNVLLPSTVDDIQLAEAVEYRYFEITTLHERVNGTQLSIPEELDIAVLAWRQVRVRHKAGDYRNSVEELRMVKLIAQWTVDVNAKLRNQEAKKVEWSH